MFSDGCQDMDGKPVRLREIASHKFDPCIHEGRYEAYIPG
jgi:hypothetical protein